MLGKQGRLLPTWSQAFLDAILINLAFITAWWARYEMELGREVLAENYVGLESYLFVQLALTAILLGVYQLQGLYRRRRGAFLVDELGIIMSGATIGVAAVIVVTFYLRPYSYSRLVFLYAGVAIIVLLGTARFAESLLRGYLHKKGIGLERVLVVGADSMGLLIMRNIYARPDLGYRVVGFLDGQRRQGLGPFQSLGTPDEVSRVVSEQKVDQVIIALPSAAHSKTMEIVSCCERERVPFRLVPDYYQLSLSQVDVNEINGVPLIGLRETTLRGWNSMVKRLIDVVLASLMLVVLSVPMALMALAIKLESPGPVLLRQVRLGRGGSSFTFHKFRSMRASAEREISELAAHNEARGPFFKMKRDPRVTRVGRWLRRASLDELPQLVNVLKGDMSLVGPRPPLPYEVEKYEDWHRKRFEASPGMTGLWQVSGRSDLTFDEMALLDLYYIENWSLGLDIKIMLQTLPAIISGTGAY